MMYDRHTYTVQNPAAIHAVVLTEADVPVEILSSGDDSMHAVYYDSEKEWYDIEVEDGILYIKKNIRFMVGLFMFRKEPEHVRLTLYLPAGYAGELKVASADGSIRIDGVTMSSAAIKTSDGKIAIIRSHINEDITCKAVDGDISVERITASEVSLKTTDGKIMLDRPLISNRLSCRTTDGGIKGVLAGRASDYTFEVKIVDGKSNVKSGGTGRTVCALKATDGKINISFEDEG